MTKEKKKGRLGLTAKIVIGMAAGIIIGSLINIAPHNQFVDEFITNGAFYVGGKLFISIMKMMVVPIVFVSLVCGVCSLGDINKLGRIGIKTLVLYLLTTSIAIALGIFVAETTHVGKATAVAVAQTQALNHDVPSVVDTLANMIPSNPIAAMAQGNMLQIIIFALLFGMAIQLTRSTSERITKIFNDLNEVLLKLITVLMKAAPYGVFCLLAGLFARKGIVAVNSLIGYFSVVLGVLFIHLFVSYSLILKFLGRLNPVRFFQKMYPAMLFGFSTSSSSVSIPVVLNTVEKKMGVKNSVASFIVPLGATINMDGTAIMQGVATVFISHIYNIPIGITGYLVVILMATLASIGTAGVPGVGLITLTMVLQQVGLPVEGIAMIIGVDRLLDMVRTAVNISGDSVIACVVGKSENAIDMKVYNDPDI